MVPLRGLRLRAPGTKISAADDKELTGYKKVFSVWEAVKRVNNEEPFHMKINIVFGILQKCEDFCPITSADDGCDKLIYTMMTNPNTIVSKNQSLIAYLKTSLRAF
jgi:hypothetical protein